jgi:hypothetical protein
VAVNQDRPKTQTEGPRQFSLWGLMVFVTVFSLWCSQFAVIRELSNVQGQLQPPWTALVGAVLVWFGLAAHYYRQRVFGVLGVHCLAPLVVGALTCALEGFVVVALMVNLVGFPGVVITMTARWLRGQPVETQPGPPGREEPLCEPQPNADERESLRR